MRHAELATAAASRSAARQGYAKTMAVDRRKIAIAIAGFSTFLTLYSPQALLPSLAREFGVGAAEISAIMTASTLAIALTAPFTGAVADVLGRKRVIAAAMLAVVVPLTGAALAPDVQALIAWRFLQGLLLPPIFAVTVAYIGDEWPPAQVAGVAGIYIAGSSLGGFCGRLVPGVLGDLIGWRGAFLTLAGLSLMGAVALALLLPREKGFVRSQGLAASARQMLRHLKDPQLLATYGIGFGVLFNFIAVFTYVSFHLAGPPYHFSSTLLGAIFVTYLAGTVIAPMTGWMTARLVRRRPLRDIVLYRRQHGRLPARACLGVGRLAGHDRHGGGHARHHGHDCRARLSGCDGLGSSFEEAEREANDCAEPKPFRFSAIDRYPHGMQPGRDRRPRASRVRLHRQAPALPVSRACTHRRLRQDGDVQGQARGCARGRRLHAKAA